MNETESTNKTIVDIAKKRRKRPDLTELQTPHTEPGEISRMLRQAMTISHWPPIDTDDADQVAARIDQYHTFCYENDIKPDMSGMALAIGVDRTTLWRWETGEVSKPKAVCNALKKGREINEIMMVQLMQNGKINPVTGIFLLKNNHGFRDQQEIVVTPNNPLESGAPDDIKNKYIQALPEADEKPE